jgi:hypothetical protein
MATVKYEDMGMSQLKSLTRDRGLGTGRSKQELIEKLVEYDNRLNKVDDTDLTETQVDELLREGEPVELEPAPEVKSEPVPQDEDPSPTIFRISFSHSGPLLDSDHESFRRKTWELAKAEGLRPFGGEFAARLRKAENNQLTYEIEVHDQ